MDQTTKIDLLPHIALAIASKPHVYPEIDKVYATNSIFYYQESKKYPVSQENIAQKSSLLCEIYYRKFLGIFLGNPDAGCAIIKKAYKSVWNIVKRNPSENDVYTFLNKINNDTDYSNCMFAMIALELLEHGEVRDAFQKVQECISHTLAQEYERKKRKSHSQETARKEKAAQLSALKKSGSAVLSEMYAKNNFPSETEFFNYLFDFENICINDLVLETQEKNALDDALLTYSIFADEKDFDLYMSGAYLIQKLCQSYKQAKELYFQNCPEEIQLALESERLQIAEEVHTYKQENEALRIQLSTTQQTISKKNLQIEQLQAEINRLQAELSAINSGKAELEALQNFAYRSTMEMEKSAKKKDYSELSKKKILILGGTPDWHERMKKVLPNSTCVGPDVTLNLDGVGNYDIVAIYTGYISHKMYYAAITKAKKIMYINNSNIEMALDALNNA